MSVESIKTLSTSTKSAVLHGGVGVPGKPDLENIRKLDLLPIPMIRRMQQYGIAIDREWFWDLSKRLDQEMLVLEAEICSSIPSEKLQQFIEQSNLDSDDDYAPMNVNSGDQLASLFFDVLGIGEGRQLKTTKSGARISTSKKQLEQLKRSHPIVQKTLDYRERAKLKSTYADTLPQIAREHPAGSCWCGLKHWDKTWRVHTEYMTTRTTTGRIASKLPNLQNIPSRTALGREIRKGFIASPGMRLVSCDESQEEMRLGAHYSQDPELIRIFKLGLDPHNETAKRAFKTDTPDKISQRTPSRNVNFGVFYGLTGAGLLDLMAVTYATAGMDLPEWLTEEWCDEFIQDWFKLYSGVVGYLEQQTYRARRYGMVWTLFGRIRRVPEIHSVHRHIREAGLRQAGNMPIQGSGADWMRLIMGEAEEMLLRWLKEGVWCWPLLTVHDELVVEVEEDYAEMIQYEMITIMQNVMTDKETGAEYCRVPIKADGKIQTRWDKE